MARRARRLLIYLGNQNGHPHGQIVDVTHSAFTVSFNQPAAGSSVAIHGI